jgi:two-component system, NarL family, nitrate/nitrite response regulator NarL
MSLDTHYIRSRNSAGSAASVEAALAAAPVEVGQSSRGGIGQKVRVNVRIALVDEYPLRRGSTLNLLRLHVSKGASAFSSPEELFSQAPAGAGQPKSIIFSVGERSIREAPLAEALRRLGRLGGAAACCPLIVLSDREDVEEVIASFRAGARGFIPTSLDPGLVIAAIRLVLAGHAFIPAKTLLRSYHDAPGHDAPVAPAEIKHVPLPDQIRVQNPHQWPPRQLAVLHLLGEGKSNKHIAMALNMEESTVKVHVRHIMRKLGVRNRTEVALYVRRLGVSAPAVGEDLAIPAGPAIKAAQAAV